MANVRVFLLLCFHLNISCLCFISVAGLNSLCSVFPASFIFLVFGLLIVIWSQAGEEEVYFHTHCTAVGKHMPPEPS